MAKHDEVIGLGDLHVQLRILNRLMALQIKSTVGQQDLVKLLAGTGASNAEIADVLDTTAATVSTTLQRLKKKAAKSAAGSDEMSPKLLGPGQ
ncbi:MAG TPA: hypothetical protein VGM77_12260 [Gemmatimonadales bacterium]